MDEKLTYVIELRDYTNNDGIFPHYVFEDISEYLRIMTILLERGEIVTSFAEPK